MTRWLTPRIRIFAAILAGCAVLGGAAFLWLFPWAFENEALPGVAGPIIPVVSTGRQGSTGIRAYGRLCSYCHDHAIGPALRGRGLDAATLTQFVRNGSGPMPAFRESEISNAEINAIATLLASPAAPQ